MLSSSATIEDGDWDSVRQATAALTRDLERIMLSMGQGGGDFGGATPKSARDQQVSQDGNYGYQAVTMDMLRDLENRLRAIIAAIPPTTTSLSVGGDLSGSTSSASVIKLRGVTISGTLPSVDEQVLMYNLPSTRWEPITLVASNGGLLTKDGTGLIEIAGGTALSVVGNATNTTGSINAISAASADTILGRRGTALTWAKVSTNEVNDAAITKAKMENGTACSVIGRAANTPGVTADIAASANGQILTRASNAMSFSATPTLGVSGTTNGSLTLAGATAATSMTLACSGANATIAIGNATSASAIVISPTLVTALGRVMSVREIDVCDAGTAKKMLVLASAPY